MAESTTNDAAKAKHPKYTVMVEEAIYHQKSRTGLTRQAITSLVKEKYQLEPTTCSQHVSRALKECMEKNVIASSTDNLLGHFKLSQAKKDELKKRQGRKQKKEGKKQETDADKGNKKAAKPPKNPTAKGKIADDKENDEDESAVGAIKKRAEGKVDKTTSSKTRKADEDASEAVDAKKKPLTRTNSASKLKTGKPDKQASQEIATKPKSKKKSQGDENNEQPQDGVEKKTAGRRGPRKKSSETS